MLENLETRIYRPIHLSRRGEIIAWGSAVLLAGAWLILRITGQEVNFSVPILAIFVLLSALSISLGNWMDRKTLIKVKENAISFQNGLRDLELAWSEIKEVRVIPARWGKKVQVFGDRRYFAFQTLGEVKVGGEVKGRMGFPEGDEILRQIILKGGLQIVERPGDGYYYVRQ